MCTFILIYDHCAGLFVPCDRIETARFGACGVFALQAGDRDALVLVLLNYVNSCDALFLGRQKVDALTRLFTRLTSPTFICVDR